MRRYHTDAAGENKSAHSAVGMDLRKAEAETEDFSCTCFIGRPLATVGTAPLTCSHSRTGRSEEGGAGAGAGDPARPNRKGLEAEGSCTGAALLRGNGRLRLGQVNGHPRGGAGSRQCVCTCLRLSARACTCVLSQKINEKSTVINQYESGKAIPHPQLISRLERALGVKLPRPPKKGKKKNKKK